MTYRELTEKQLELMRLLVAGETTIKDALKKLDIPTSTYYDWRKMNLWKDKLQEYLTIKNEIAIEHVKDNVTEYLKRLEELSKGSKNDMVRYQSTNQLLGLGGQVVTGKEEVKVIKDEKESKNILKEMLAKKKQENEQEEQ